MADVIKTGAVHHLTITVTDVARSARFYQDLLNFQPVTEFDERQILHNGSTLLVLGPPPDPAQAISGDRFDENRVGLDHLSFAVDSRQDLEEAIELLDREGISHGEIKDLGEGLGIYVLAFRDPDNVQLELTAPH